MDEWVWSNGGMILTGKTEVLGEKSLPVPLCPPPMLHTMTRGSNHVICCKNPVTARLSHAANTQTQTHKSCHWCLINSTEKPNRSLLNIITEWQNSHIVISHTSIMLCTLRYVSANPRCHHQGFFTTIIGILFSRTVIPITNSGYHIIIIIISPIPVAARSNAWVCGRSLAGTAGSNPAEGMDVSCECCVLSGRGLCDGLMTTPEESYRLWRVWLGSWCLDNEGALAHWGALASRKILLLLLLPLCRKFTIIYLKQDMFLWYMYSFAALLYLQFVLY